MSTWVLVKIFIANLGRLGKSLILTAKKNMVALITEVVKDPVLKIKEYGDMVRGAKKGQKGLHVMFAIFALQQGNKNCF